MKVIHIVGSIDKSSGGPARSVPKTCEYVSELGVEIELITRPSKDPINVNTSKNFKVSFYSFIGLLKFGLQLSKKKVTLIHLQHIWEPYIHIMARIARFKNIPYLITPRGMLEPWIMHQNPNKKSFGMKLYQRNDLRKASCLHATCEAEKESIRQLGFTNPVAIIPNGIDLSLIPYPRTTQNTRKIVFLSRIHQKKGLELLLDAWKMLNLKDWTLEIAGEGNRQYEEQLKQKIETEKILNVSLIGPQYANAKWEFLDTAELMILPSYSENFGIVVAEALAMGIPAITTKGTPWKELETENCGWWIELSVQNLAQAITEATHISSEQRKVMGQHGRKLIEKRYRIESVVEHIKELYNWLLGEAEKPDFVYLNNEENKNSSLKIVHFITSIDKSAGGTATYMQLLSKELKSLVDLIIITGLSAHPIHLQGVDVRFLDLSLYRWIQIKQEFMAVLVLEKPDIVHINGIWEPQTWLFQKLAHKLGIKVVLSPHGMLEPYILNRHPLKKKLGLSIYENKALRTVDYMHATAQSELDQIRKLGYNQSAQIVPNGIEISDVKLKIEWTSVQNILFLSRVHPKKGIEILIETVALLQNKKLSITIAGEGDASYMESLKKLSVEKGVAGQFDFVGGVYGDQKWKLYQKADLFVLPTYSENFGIVVPEALATGIPVITTTGTPWQELETEKCGWWIELNVPNLVKALSEAIQLQPDELKEMGLRGRILVKEKYEIKAVGIKMNEFYNRIANSTDIKNN